MATSLITPPIYATGDFIEASWANDLRDNFVLLDDRTGEDPGASGKVLVSSSSLAAAWTTPGESNQITAPKVSKAGDAMTGGLGFVGNNIGVVFGGNGQMRDRISGGTQETQIFANNDRLVMYTESGGSMMAIITNTLLTLIAAISATVGTFSGAISAASAAIAGAITGASLTTSGGISSTGGNISATAGTGTFNALVASTTINAGSDVQVAGSSVMRTALGAGVQQINFTSGHVLIGETAVTGMADTHGVTINGHLKVLGDSATIGVKSRIATGRDGAEGKFHALESPEPMFEEFGRERLAGGRAVVELPADFANFVRTDDYYVHLTPLAPAALYVAEQAPDRFTVRASNGALDTPFVWRVTARQGDLDVTRDLGGHRAD